MTRLGEMKVVKEETKETRLPTKNPSRGLREGEHDQLLPEGILLLLIHSLNECSLGGFLEEAGFRPGLLRASKGGLAGQSGAGLGRYQGTPAVLTQ